MSDNNLSQDTHDPRLDRILAEFVEAEEKGQDVTPDTWIDRYPEFADELREFCSGRRRFNDLVSPGMASDEDIAAILPPSNGSTGGADEESFRVRYFGEYELLEEIARGGMGVVYKARQTTLKRVVALKMILSGQLASEEDVKRFYAEAEAAAKLDHPNIVPIFEIGQHERQHYFSMAYVEGESLAHKVNAGPLPPREAARLMMKVTAAVNYAHIEGVVHRDLKPANVLLDQDGVPRITDFGLAKRISTESVATAAEDSAAGLTVTGQVLGTPSYMSPEQASGKTDEIGPSADVYSLGAMLYCLLTGRPPFQAASPLNTLMQVLQKEPVPVRQLNPQVNRDLETICLKCLEKEPHRRYASARELADDLQRYLNGEPIKARPVSGPEQLWGWCKRNPIVAGLTAAVAVVLLSGIIVSSYFAIKARNETTLAERNAKDALEQRNRANREATVAQQQRDRAQMESRRAFRNFYLAQMNLAQRDWDQAEIGNLLDRLEKTRPEQTGDYDLRGFEWHYWQRVCHSELRTLKGHSPGVVSVAFSPDGTQIVSGGERGEVKVCDAVTGQETVTLPGYGNPVTGVAFSPDGTRIVSGYGDRTARVWDAVTGQLILTLIGHSSLVNCVAFKPDGTQIVSGSGNRNRPGQLKVWDAVTGQETLNLDGHRSPVNSVTFSPDGTRIVSGSDDNLLRLWDATTGQEKLTLRGHKRRVSSVAFSPDGTRIVSGGDDATVRLWNAATGQEKLTLRGHKRGVSGVAFSPDGTRIVSAAGSTDILSGRNTGEIKVWDSLTGQQILALNGHHGPVTCVAFDPDGTQFVTGSSDTTLKVWNAAIGPNAMSLPGLSQFVNSVAFSPDGTQIVSASDRRFSRLGELNVWDATTGLETMTLKGHDDPVSPVSSVAFSPDGTKIVSGSGSVDDASGKFKGEIKVWDGLTGEEILTLKGHDDPVRSVAFSPDGTKIVSGSYDKTVRLWDATTGDKALTFSGHKSEVRTAVFSPDGRKIVSGSKDSVKVWDAETGQELLTLKGHSQVSSVAFSPDGNRIVGGDYDATVRVWDADTGQELLTLKGHTEKVLSVAFSPDGTQIVSGSGDANPLGLRGEVKVWDAVTGQETVTLPGHGTPVTSVAFSPDGTRIVSGGRGMPIAEPFGEVNVWDARPWTPELRTKYEARGRLTALCTSFSSPEELRQSISTDTAIAEPVRELAVEWAEDFWDGLVHRDARRRVDALFATGLLKKGVIEALNGEMSVPDSVRQQAIRLAEAGTEDADALNSISWVIVIDRRRTDADYRDALKCVEVAARIEPDNADFLTTLGIAQYRVGKFTQALKTLHRSEKLKANRRSTLVMANAAFLAMTHARLGQTEEAEQLLEELRQLPRSNSPMVQRLLREAISLTVP